VIEMRSIPRTPWSTNEQHSVNSMKAALAMNTTRNNGDDFIVGTADADTDINRNTSNSDTIITYERNLNEQNTNTNARNSTNTKVMKVLCLHSFRTSKEIMKLQLQMGGWDKLLLLNNGSSASTGLDTENNSSSSSSFEFICVDGVFKATGEAPADVKMAFPNMGSYQWYDAERNEKTGAMEYLGIEESAKFVDDFVEREKIDGLLGFSQGATLIGELLKRRRRRKEKQHTTMLPIEDCEDCEDSRRGQKNQKNHHQQQQQLMKSLRFAVLISGMPSRADEKLCEQYEKNNTTMNLAALADDDVVVDDDDDSLFEPIFKSIPTLHIVGKQDRSIPPQLTHQLCKEFGEKATIVEHEKAHVIPKVYENEIGEKIKAFFQDRLREKLLCEARL